MTFADPLAILSFFPSSFPGTLHPFMLPLEAIEEAPVSAVLDKISMSLIALRALYLRWEIFGEAQ